MDKKLFPKKLQSLLNHLGWTQKYFSEQLKIDEQTVSRWINGISFPNKRNLNRIEKHTGCNPEFLLGNEETMFLARALTYTEIWRFWLTLENIRKDLGWDRNKFLFSTGILEEDLNAWKNGTRIPANETLSRIAHATGCRREYLLTWEGPKWQEGKEPKKNETFKFAKIEARLKKLENDMEILVESLKEKCCGRAKKA